MFDLKNDYQILDCEPNQVNPERISMKGFQNFHRIISIRIAILQKLKEIFAKLLAGNTLQFKMYVYICTYICTYIRNIQILDNIFMHLINAYAMETNLISTQILRVTR